MDQRGGHRSRADSALYRAQEDVYRGRDQFENPDRIDRAPEPTVGQRQPREVQGAYRRQQTTPREDRFWDNDFHAHDDNNPASQFRQMQSVVLEEEAGDDEAELTGKERMKQFRERATPLWEKRRSEEWRDIQEDIQDEIDAADKFTSSTKGIWESISGTYSNTKTFISKFALWNSKLKMVEGTFGSGVYNFFKFLKWAMGLNLMMTVLTVMLISVPEHFNEDPSPVCQVPDWRNTTLFPVTEADNCCSAIYNENQQIKREPLDVSFESFVKFISDIGTILINLLYGDGWMESTYLYYGKYNYDNAGIYQMAVAYFFVIFCCFAISLIRLVMHTAKYFKQGFKFNEFNTNQYFDLVFCSWDHSINTEESVRLAKVRIMQLYNLICPHITIIFQLAFSNEIKTALFTDERQRKEGERSTMNKISLNLKRILIWIFVALVIGTFIYGVYRLYQLGLDRGTDDECGSIDYLDVDSAVTSAKCLLNQYATTMAITVGNLLLPFIFSYLAHFEEYDPKTQLMFDLVRNIIIRLSGLLVIIGGHIYSNRYYLSKRTENVVLITH